MLNEFANRTVAIIVAHPDDEAIFMGGILPHLAAAGANVDYICATNYFGSDVLTNERRMEFRRAACKNGARSYFLECPDENQSLRREALIAGLMERDAARDYDLVITHGIWGEYGHRHHRNVSAAVHAVFPGRTWSLAGPFTPQISYTLSEDELHKKRCRTARIYRSQPFAADWCSEEERFIRLPPAVAADLANFATCSQESVPAARVTDEAVIAAAKQSLAVLSAAAPDIAEIEHIPKECWAPAFATFAAALSRFLGNQ